MILLFGEIIFAILNALFNPGGPGFIEVLVSIFGPLFY